MLGVDRDSAIVGGESQLVLVDIHGEHVERTKGSGKLDGRHAEPSHTKNGRGFAGLEPRLAQRMECGGRGAHKRRALLKGNFVWQRDRIAGGGSYIFGIATAGV